MVNGDNESYYVKEWFYKHRERLRYSWVLQRKTQKKVQKNGTSYERKSTPFSIDFGTKYSLFSHMQRMSKIKDVWEPEHHIITKNVSVYNVKSAYDNVKVLHTHSGTRF